MDTPPKQRHLPNHPTASTTISATSISRTQEDATCPSTDFPLTQCTTSVPLCGLATVDLLPSVDLPREVSEWEEADSFFRVHLVPRVCREETVDGMNHALCTRIYDFFARTNNNEMPSNQHPRQHPSTANQHVDTLPRLTNTINTLPRNADTKGP